MGADNWAQCPRCATRRIQHVEAETARVQGLYGKVPVEEFDRERSRLADTKATLDTQCHTFREDYEVYGAGEGVVTVEYHGCCSGCGLTFAFRDEHPIPMD